MFYVYYVETPKGTLWGGGAEGLLSVETLPSKVKISLDIRYDTANRRSAFRLPFK